MINVSDAQKLILSTIRPNRPIKKSITDIKSLAISQNIFADRDYPPFNRITMDGYGLSASDINEKQINEFNVIGHLQAGQTFDQPIPSGSCIKVMTGAPLPNDIDSVIKVEDSTEHNGKVRFSLTNIKSGLNIAKEGEDCLKDKLVIKENTLCNTAVISLLASTGHHNVKVYPKPTVSIISTGDEIVSPDSIPLSHQIRDSNSYTIRSLLANYDITPQFSGIVKDNKEELTNSIELGLLSDILIISGGVSMGDVDLIPDILSQMKIEKVFHKVKVKPGKPIWFGTNPQGGVVFGLPGNNMSCQVGFKLFIEAYIREYMHLTELKTLYLPIISSRTKKGDREEYFPCRIINKPSSIEVISFKGSGDVLSTLNSDGLAKHPHNINAIKENSIIEFYPWRPL